MQVVIAISSPLDILYAIALTIALVIAITIAITTMITITIILYYDVVSMYTV